MRRFMKKAVALALAAAMMIPVSGISADAKLVLAQDTIDGKDSSLVTTGNWEGNTGYLRFTTTDGILYLGNYDLSAVRSVKVTINKYEKKNTNNNPYSLSLGYMDVEKDTVTNDYLAAQSATIRDADHRIGGAVFAGAGSGEDERVVTFQNSGVTLEPSDEKLSISEQRDAKYTLGESNAEGALMLYAQAAQTTIRIKNIVIEYVKEEKEEYTVTVDGEAYNNVAYNSHVTVKADAEKDGVPFTCWVKNGMPVALTPEYSFYVHENATLEPYYSDDSRYNGFPVDAPMIGYTTYEVDQVANTITYYIEYNCKDADTVLRPFVKVYKTTTGDGTPALDVTNAATANSLLHMNMTSFGQYKVTFEGYKDESTTPITVSVRCADVDNASNVSTSFTALVGPGSWKRASVAHISGNVNNRVNDFKSNN